MLKKSPESIFVLLVGLFLATGLGTTGLAVPTAPNYPSAIWLKDPDYYVGRKCDARALGCKASQYHMSYNIQYIVVHATDGNTATSAINEFRNRADKSTHYIIANNRDSQYKEGQIIQMVRDEDTAWTLGIWPERSTGTRRGPVHHFNSINIELVGKPDQKSWCSQRMYESVANLIRFLSQRYAIPLSRSRILGHDEAGRLTDPPLIKGDPCGHDSSRCTFDWAYLMQQVGAGTIVLPLPPPTATVLVMDVSGSMGWRWKGGVKIESAKQAALQFIEQVANEPRLPGVVHEIAVVTFTGDANLALQLTSSYAQAKRVVIELEPVASTNVGAGLTTALRELDKAAGAKRFIILLSDGMSNTGLSKSQILSGPVIEAKRKGICIHTVAFGDPGDIDEKFLRNVADGSGCGIYSYASTPFELFGTYVKVRHMTLGSKQIVAFTSKGMRVITLPGSAISLGAFKLIRAAQELHYTLAWSEGGRMQAKLVDPAGRTVTSGYPGAKIYSGTRFSHMTVFSPKQGIWRVSAVPQQRFPAQVQYYGVVSSRPGGVLPFDLPIFCIGDWCIPWPDLPTPLIVTISIVVFAVFLYQQLIAK